MSRTNALVKLKRSGTSSKLRTSSPTKKAGTALKSCVTAKIKSTRMSGRSFNARRPASSKSHQTLMDRSAASMVGLGKKSLLGRSKRSTLDPSLQKLAMVYATKWMVLGASNYKWPTKSVRWSGSKLTNECKATKTQSSWSATCSKT